MKRSRKAFDPCTILIAVQANGQHISLPSGWDLTGMTFDSIKYVGSECDRPWLVQVSAHMKDPVSADALAGGRYSNG